jgi:hypothetical protein
VAQVAIGVVAFAVLAAVLRIVSPQELRDLRALVRSRGRAQEPVQDTGLDA